MNVVNYLPNTNDKTEFQDLVSDKLVDKEFKAGLLYLPTGVGKTKAALDTVKKLNPKKVLWLVPTTKLRDEDLPAEFRKWNLTSLLNKTDILCYASSHKVDNDYDVIVYDEAHNITERSMTDLMDKNLHKKANKQLFLTATPPSEYEKQVFITTLAQGNDPQLLKTEKSICRVYMPISEARKREFISDFDIRIFDMQLDPNIKTKRKGQTLDEVRHYEKLTGIMRSIQSKGGNVKWIALERLRFFKNLQSKENAVKKIRKLIPEGKRYVVFCGSIEQANSLSNHVYHSKSGDKWLNKFVKGEINDLYVIDRIDEGVNLPELDGILVVQSNSKARKFIQRSGRALRVRDGHKAFIWLVRCVGTRDEYWVQQSIDEINK